MKYLVFLLFCSGCSVVFTNQESPLKLDRCQFWAPTIDTVLAGVTITTSAAVYDARIEKDPTNRDVMLYVGTMYASMLAISALSGFAEYGECRGVFPIYK